MVNICGATNVTLSGNRVLRKMPSPKQAQIPSPPNLTRSQNKIFSGLQCFALSTNLAVLFLQGYAFLTTLSWVPLLWGVSQAFTTLFNAAFLWHSYRAAQYKPPVATGYPSVHPRVALTLTAKNEPVDLVAESLTALWNVDYSSKDVFLLDDSSPDSSSSASYAQMVQDLAQNGIHIRHVRRKFEPAAFHGGFKAGNINHFLNRYGRNYKYFASFDADFQPTPNFLEVTVPIMESPENGKIAILQTAQQFKYEPDKPAAVAAWVGNAAMGDLHGKGKDKNQTLFWYGSSALLRTQALLEAALKRGAPDAPIRMDTLAEDYDTSVGITRETDGGWQVRYLDTYLSTGVEPQSLLRYLRQQRRWIWGSAEVVGKRLVPTLPDLIKNGEYEKAFLIISDTLYRLTPFQHFFFMTAPVGLAMSSSTSDIQNTHFIIGTVLLSILANWSPIFYRGIMRGCEIKDILRNLDLHALTLPAYIEGFLRSFSSKKAVFETTNTARTRHERLPLKWLMPTLAILASSIGTLFYALGDAINKCLSLVDVSYLILTINCSFLLLGIRASSRLAEFNDGWKATFSDLWAGLKQSFEKFKGEMMGWATSENVNLFRRFTSYF